MNNLIAAWLWLSENFPVIMLCVIIASIVLWYVIWSYRLFNKAEDHIENGHKMDPYIDEVRQKRAEAGYSIAVVVTIFTIEGKQRRFYYHENSETRFRVTDDDVLYLDI